MNKTLIWVIVIVLIIIGGFTYFKKPTEPGEQIKVGVVLPLSGFAANYGDESKNGLAIALTDLQKKYPRLNLDITYEDSLYNPKGAVDAYQKLKNVGGIDALIVGASHVAIPIKPLAEQDGVLEIAVWSGAPSYSDTHNLNFRTTLLADDWSPAILSFLQKKSYKNLATLYAQNEFGTSFDKSISTLAPQYGVTVVSNEGFLNEEKDFRSQLTKLKAAKPDAVFFVGAVSQLVTVLKQAKELGVETQFLSTTPAEDPQLIAGAGEAAEGLIYSYSFDLGSIEAKDFSNKYITQFKRDPTFYAAESYVGLQLLAEAIDRCDYKKDVSCWKTKLDDLKDLNTILGVGSINEKGDLKAGGAFLKIIKGGKFIRYEE